MDKQNAVKAVTVAALLVAALFYIPWRIEPSGALRWAPAYRPPMIYSVAYEDNVRVARYVYNEGTIAFGVLILQLGIIAGTGRLLYVQAGREQDDFEGNG
ncbi:MAG: hypothetical protein RhofKO_41240 [Rhodothermales bacterium]